MLPALEVCVMQERGSLQQNQQVNLSRESSFLQVAATVQFASFSGVMRNASLVRI